MTIFKGRGANFGAETRKPEAKRDLRRFGGSKHRAAAALLSQVERL
jgi:hypothetical protein